MAGRREGPLKGPVSDEFLLSMSVRDLNQYLKGVPTDQVSHVQSVKSWDHYLT